eukprot:COSAG06_NODE_52139_length_307_cov_1.447115_1_plen_54_part_01
MCVARGAARRGRGRAVSRGARRAAGLVHHPWEETEPLAQLANCLSMPELQELLS